MKKKFMTKKKPTSEATEGPPGTKETHKPLTRGHQTATNPTSLLQKNPPLISTEIPDFTKIPTQTTSSNSQEKPIIGKKAAKPEEPFEIFKKSKLDGIQHQIKFQIDSSEHTLSRKIFSGELGSKSGQPADNSPIKDISSFIYNSLMSKDEIIGGLYSKHDILQNFTRDAPVQ